MELTPLVSNREDMREGRGFSMQELHAVELTKKDAILKEIPIDGRRKSSYTENIDKLKAFLKKNK